ncbi:MAG: aspartate kinase [Oscillospiraceae bacterium]|nr:aspartate kinase [Oscillospiraceae bacterium]
MHKQRHSPNSKGDYSVSVKVVKFGGSSLADANQFIKVANIIKADPARKYVVPSAPGKRNSKDTKVTDMLYACYDMATRGGDFEGMFSAIKSRYMDIINGLGLSMSLDDEFETIERGFKARAGRDYAASRGEYLNGKILAAYLGFAFVDAADVIFFANDSKLKLEETCHAVKERLDEVGNAVIPGFYGSMPNDTIKTFSRGGSDITGSIVAAAMGVDLYENWTDVSGFLVCDPRIVPDPVPIKTITYQELRELSYMGAGVLHEDAIFPVRRSCIPINIKNTNSPDDPGTMIVENASGDSSEYVITGIAGHCGFVTVTIEKDMMNSELGFGRKVLEVFETYGISFEHMPSGIDTMSIVVHKNEYEEKEEQIIRALERSVHPDRIDVDRDVALVAVVGRGMRKQRGTAARIFAALAHKKVNVKMIDQGSSELNIIVGISNEDFETSIKAIYDIFVTQYL